MARSKINSDHPTLLTTNQRNDDDARTYAYRHDRGDSLCLADTLSRTLRTNRKSAILVSPGPRTARRSTSLHLVYRAPEHSDIGIIKRGEHLIDCTNMIGVKYTDDREADKGLARRKIESNFVLTLCTSKVVLPTYSNGTPVDIAQLEGVDVHRCCRYHRKSCHTREYTLHGLHKTASQSLCRRAGTEHVRNAIHQRNFSHAECGYTQNDLLGRERLT